MFAQVGRFIGRPKVRNTIIVVSGLPRSGTSMLMKMLEAGGLEVLTDNIRVPDDDNPGGYYEFERVKKLPEGDIAWLKDARGKAVKVISALLRYLPLNYEYKIIFMRRKIAEVLASQRKMLAHRGEEPYEEAHEKMDELFEKHLKEIGNWLRLQPNIEVLYVDYNSVLANPEPWTRKINAFLGGFLDEKEMSLSVDKRLYRNRDD